MEQRAEKLIKENENAKTDIVTMQATITDLKEQVKHWFMYLQLSNNFNQSTDEYDQKC